MKAKQKHRTKMLEYLGNPENDIPNREGLAYAIGIKKPTLYMHFTPEELSEIEAEGLSERRKKYAPQISKVDTALLKKASSGDPLACKLVYQRFEGWSEKQQVDVSNPDGSMRPTIIEVYPGDKSKG